MQFNLYYTRFYSLSRKLSFGALVLFFLVVITFSVFYISGSKEYLTQWFYGMNTCFYRNGEWTQKFFTNHVKAAGNYFAMVASAICLSGLVSIFLKRRKYFFTTTTIQNTCFKKRVWLWYVPVVALAFGNWYWGQANIKPSADEIFSAVNCAELSPFQVLAYYMLPNNHICFNFINGYLARGLNTDTLQTGRTLSLMAYIGVICIAFHWLCRLLNHRLWSYAAVAPLAFQFSVWAFGFQARGYECQLFCGWLAFLSIFNYIKTGERFALKVNTFFSILGFAFVPTFLYYFIAQCVFVLLVKVSKRQMDLQFWKYQFFCLAGVYLLYLPALCFSGLAALTGNDYVKTSLEPLTAFLPHFLEVLKYFINFIFGFMIRENHPLMFILFIIPAALFFFKDNSRKQLGLFYFTLWITWTVICLYMERCPFSRNMIIHYSLSLAIIIYTIYLLAECLLMKVKSVLTKNILKSLLFAMPVIIFCSHLLVWGSFNSRYLLYFMNVNDMYNDYTRDVAMIPAGSSVACSPERYCFYYFCRKGQYHVSRCAVGNEDFYVTSSDEPLPTEIAGKYIHFKTGNEGDEIYKRK